MHELVLTALRAVATAVVEVGVEKITRAVVEPAAPAAAPVAPQPAAIAPPPPDPVDVAAGMIHGFLQAIQDRSLEACWDHCEAEWAQDPATVDLITHTMRSARPVAWGFREVKAPEGWRPGKRLRYLDADVAVTFDTEPGYETIHARIIAVRVASRQYRIAHLEWIDPQPPPPAEPQPLASPEHAWSAPQDDFSAIMAELFAAQRPPPEAELVCAGCRGRMRVPADKGQLRVTCRRCGNVQWFQP